MEQWPPGQQTRQPIPSQLWGWFVAAVGNVWFVVKHVLILLLAGWAELPPSYADRRPEALEILAALVSFGFWMVVFAEVVVPLAVYLT